MVEYSISADDFYDDGKKKKKKKAAKSTTKASSSNGLKIKPFYIHLGLIVLLILFLIFYFMNDLSFEMNSEEKDEIILIGDMSAMNLHYAGDLVIDSSDYVLETANSKFDGKSGDVEVYGFDGQIRLFNETMIFEGVAQKVVFKNNELKLAGGVFYLDSKKKTSVDLFFENVVLRFDEGIVKVNSDLNMNFEDTSIKLSGFNTTMNYDGKFVFNGFCDNFTMMRQNPNIEIVYRK